MTEYVQEPRPTDLPVVIVAAIAAAVVLVLVFVFLVMLPNRELRRVLEEKNHRLEVVLAERRMIAENQPAYQQERAHIQDESKRLEDRLVAHAETLKEVFTKAFAPHKFAMNSFIVGPERQAPDDHWWKVVPFEYTVIGPREELLPAIAKLRSQSPETVRLVEVDIRKLEDGKRFSVHFQCNLQTLTALRDLPKETLEHYAAERVPPSALFETQSVKTLRSEIKDKEKALQDMQNWEEQTALFRRDKQRLEAALVRRADFTALREREFDSLESQLRAIFAQPDVQDAYRIIVKVQETLINKKKLQETQAAAE